MNSDEEPEDEPADGTPEAVDSPDDDVVEAPAPEFATRPLVTSDAALTFPEARRLTSRRGGRVVLLMGETGAGKTTLMVEAWTQLVAHGPLGQHRLAGSRTAIAFEERAYLSRLAAGTDQADTKRTHVEEDGLLHLRVARPDGRRVELLIADFAGEHFRRIREGVPLLDELPWAGRADRVAVLLDGGAIGLGGGARELSFNHASRQLLAVRTAGVLAPTARVAILLLKDDQHDDARLAEAEPRLTSLLSLARELDPGVECIRVAARPADGSLPRGLDRFIAWAASDDQAVPGAAVELPVPSRAIARVRP